MLLRRMISHVKTQNWLAVMLDFVIVVAGVVLGVQIGNWNAARHDSQAYSQALARYKAEIDLNLATLDSVDMGMARSLTAMDEGFNALLSCEETPENRIAVETAVNIVLGTHGISLRDQALLDLTTTAIYLDQQSDRDRQQFGTTRHLMQTFLREAEYIEYLPLEERAQNNPILTVGNSARRDMKYLGADYSRVDRALVVAVPLDEACQDNMLVKSLFTWERWQSALPAVSRILREQFEADLAYLESRT